MGLIFNLKLYFVKFFIGNMWWEGWIAWWRVSYITACISIFLLFLIAIWIAIFSFLSESFDLVLVIRTAMRVSTKALIWVRAFGRSSSSFVRGVYFICFVSADQQSCQASFWKCCGVVHLYKSSLGYCPSRQLYWTYICSFTTAVLSGNPSLEPGCFVVHNIQHAQFRVCSFKVWVI